MASTIFADLLNSSADRHSPLDDAQGIVAGSMLAVLGVSLLSGAGLLAGGTAGLAFLAHYATGLSFGLCFFAVNLPFYYFAFRRLGLAFTIKTFAAIALTSALSEFVSGFITIAHVDPVAGANTCVTQLVSRQSHEVCAALPVTADHIERLRDRDADHLRAAAARQEAAEAAGGKGEREHRPG